MSVRVIRSLYGALLRSNRQIEKDLEVGHTLYNAVRSGALQTYDGIKADWRQERVFAERFKDLKTIEKWNKKPSYITLIRSHFEQKAETNETKHQLLDKGFESLKKMDDHITLIKNLSIKGAFDCQKRKDTMNFRVGQVVKVKDNRLGVIYNWYQSHRKSNNVVYDVLLNGNPSKSLTAHRLLDEDMMEVSNPSPINHPSLLLFFDGFDSKKGMYIPSEALACRFPEDTMWYSFAWKYHQNSIPSILQLHHASEEELVSYLSSSDHTVVQLASAALEGKWSAECGEKAKDQARTALKLVDANDLGGARSLLEAAVTKNPGFAYGLCQLGLVELRSDKALKAMEYYKRALDLKPFMMDALNGYGTSAARLHKWNIAHESAIKLLRIQPNNTTAHLLHITAIFHSI